MAVVPTRSRKRCAKAERDIPTSRLRRSRVQSDAGSVCTRVRAPLDLRITQGRQETTAGRLPVDVQAQHLHEQCLCQSSHQGIGSGLTGSGLRHQHGTQRGQPVDPAPAAVGNVQERRQFGHQRVVDIPIQFEVTTNQPRDAGCVGEQWAAPLLGIDDLDWPTTTGRSRPAPIDPHEDPVALARPAARALTARRLPCA